VQPTNTQVERSLAALRLGATATPAAPAAALLAERHDGDAADLPDGLLERLERASGVRPERLEEARERMACGDEPSADDLADRMVGRLVCDRLR
jgi:hypothetical protein